MATKLRQTKHLTTDVFLAALAEARAAWPYDGVGVWGVVQQLPDWPPKIVYQKARNLIRDGVLDGCGCGCGTWLTDP